MSTITRIMRVSHIYSAAPVLLLMVFFAITGVYLNHPEFDEGSVTSEQREVALPAWADGDWDEAGPPAPMVLKLLHWLDDEHQISGIDFTVEYDEFDSVLIIDMAGPDGTTLVEMFFEEQTVLVDQRELSLLATLNNLHRAKHVTGFWLYLSDFSAICMLIFCISGFWLIAVNKLERAQASIALLTGCVLFIFTAVVLH